MALTKDEFAEMAKLICPHCRNNMVPRRRVDTGEWVHDGANWHSICWASGLRNSRFAEGVMDG